MENNKNKFNIFMLMNYIKKLIFLYILLKRTNIILSKLSKN